MADRSAHIFSVAGRRGGAMREPRDLAIGKPRGLITMPLAAVLSIGLVLTGGGRAEAATCSVPFPYLTIQSAVNDPNCTTINVAAGGAREGGTLSARVTL